MINTKRLQRIACKLPVSLNVKYCGKKYDGCIQKDKWKKIHLF